MISIRETAEKFNTVDFRGVVRIDENMAQHTTMRVGGAAPLFVEPRDVESLVFAMRTLRDSGVSYYTLGGGSNVIVSDNGFDGAVVSTCGLDSLSQNADGVLCGAGVAMSRLVSFCADNALSGFEEFAGLPGTLGGAAFMNVRCFEKSISDIFIKADYIDCNTLEKKTYRFDAADWDYKKSPFQTMNCIIVEVALRVSHEPEKKADIEAACRSFIEQRREKGHFKFPSAGSVFKNNRAFGAPTGKIIDELGLKGFKIGGAQIASWHGNFIINTGNATASDIKALVDFIAKIVKEKTGFDLECEIIFCGMW